MQPFAIYCTTCKARLRVTDPSFIGQILACPKCESMVLVEPPPAGVGDSPAASKPASLSGSSSVVLRAPISTTPPPLPPIASPPVAKASVPPAKPASRPLPAAVTTAPAKATQNWTLFAGGIAVGVVIGAAIWLLVAMRDTGGDPVAISTAEAATIETAPESPSAPQTTAEQANVEPPEAPTRPLPKSIEVLKPISEATVADPIAPQESAPPEVVRKETLETESPEAPAAANPLPPQPVAEPTQDTAPTEPAETKPVEHPEPAPEPAKTATTDPQLAELNVRLPKVAFDKVPLRQFVTFAAEASGSNIVIDYRSLRAAGFKSPTITARATDRTLGELLHESLDKIGLAFEPREGTIVIFAP